MARSGISKLKWTGMSRFNSDDHYICYCGQEFLRRNEIAFIFKKRVQNAVLWCNLKNNRMISVSKAIHSTSQYSKSFQSSNAEEAEVEWFYEDLQDL